MSRPPCGPGRAVRLAPWAVAMAFTIVRPSPWPSAGPTRWSPRRWKGWNRRSTSTNGTTAPVLLTVRRAPSSVVLVEICDGAAGDVVADRVVEQVRDQARNEVWVAGRDRALQGRADLDAVTLCVMLAAVDDVSRDLSEVEWIPGLDAAFAGGERQQRIDQPLLLAGELPAPPRMSTAGPRRRRRGRRAPPAAAFAGRRAGCAAHGRRWRRTDAGTRTTPAAVRTGRRACDRAR